MHFPIAIAPYIAGKTDTCIVIVSATFPSIKFHHLPPVTPVSTTVTHYEELTLEILP